MRDPAGKGVELFALNEAGAGHDREWGHVLRYDCSSPNDRPMSDRDSWGDGRAGADPDVRLDDNGPQGDAVISLGESDGVTGCAEGDVRPDHCPVTDRDAADVQEPAALVDEDLVAELDVQAVVAVERRGDLVRLSRGGG